MKLRRAYSPFVGIVLSCISILAYANQAPTVPGNFLALAESSTQVSLSWDRATDDRRVQNYQLSRNGVLITTTKKTNFTDNNLQASTIYSYELRAYDGELLSALASFTVSTPGTESSGDSPDASPGNKGKGGRNSKPSEEPPAEEPPAEEPPAEEPVSGVPSGWQLAFADEFDGSGDLSVGLTDSNWRFENMEDGLHRAGNTGIDAAGNPIAAWDSVRGKRWSAWYDNFNDANAYRENGDLVMGGYMSGEVDPTRPIDYIDDGVLTQYGSSKLYTAWIDTFSRKWVGPGDLHVADPESPNRLFKYGYVETRVNLSEIQTPGFRLSMWLMPASTDSAGQNLVVDTAYDGDGNNGVELDLFEYEWIGPEYGNRIHMAVIGGAAGSDTTSIDMSEYGVDLRDGYHTIGFLWTEDKLVWSINGQIVKQILDIDLIPDVYSYLIVSREMNSGVKNPDIDNVDATDVLEEWPYRPRDPGLYAKNIWEYRDRINSDRALLDYIRVWQP